MCEVRPSNLSTYLLANYCSCILRKGANAANLAAVWKQTWQITVRTISLPATSRAACFLLHMILETDLIPYHLIADDINSIVTTADVNGPAILVDSSLNLMLHLLQARNTRLPSASQTTCHHVIRWAFRKWNAGRSPYTEIIYRALINL
jgi:ataxia telangiectasia mutated family protein